jgi:hypothetical protein
VILENNGLVAAFISIWQFVRTIIVENDRTINRRGAHNVGIHPERNAVKSAPVFTGKFSHGYKVFLLPLVANLGDVRSRTDSQGMLSVFGVIFG